MITTEGPPYSVVTLATVPPVLRVMCLPLTPVAAVVHASYSPRLFTHTPTAAVGSPCLWVCWLRLFICLVVSIPHVCETLQRFVSDLFYVA